MYPKRAALHLTAGIYLVHKSTKNVLKLLIFFKRNLIKKSYQSLKTFNSSSHKVTMVKKGEITTKRGSIQRSLTQSRGTLGIYSWDNTLENIQT